MLHYQSISLLLNNYSLQFHKGRDYIRILISRGLILSNRLSVSLSVLFTEPPNSERTKSPSAPLGPPPSNVVPGVQYLKLKTRPMRTSNCLDRKMENRSKVMINQRQAQKFSTTISMEMVLLICVSLSQVFVRGHATIALVKDSFYSCPCVSIQTKKIALFLGQFIRLSRLVKFR